MKLTYLIPVFMILLTFAAGCTNEKVDEPKYTTTIAEVKTPTPTPTPTPEVTVAVPTTIKFTVLHASESGNTVVTTDNKIVYVQDTNNWNDLMPNSIYACAYEGKEKNVYAASNCKKYAFQNPQHVIYPLKDNGYHQIKMSETQYFQFGSELVSCKMGNCVKYVSAQNPMGGAFKQFPPYTLFG